MTKIQHVFKTTTVTQQKIERNFLDRTKGTSGKPAANGASVEKTESSARDQEQDKDARGASALRSAGGSARDREAGRDTNGTRIGEEEAELSRFTALTVLRREQPQEFAPALEPPSRTSAGVRRSRRAQDQDMKINCISTHSQ